MLKKLNIRGVLIAFSFLLIFVLFASMILSPTPAFSGGVQQIDEIANSASKVIGQGQAALVKIAMAAVPFSLIAILLLVVFSHNDKKISGLLSIAITILVAAVLILIVNNGALMSILNDIVKSFVSFGNKTTP